VNYKDFLKNKKIAVIGMGPHGEMVADIKFLLMNKAQVSLFDIRSEKRLKGFLPKLKSAGLERYTFGKVDPQDFSDALLVLLSPEISKKSIFLKKSHLDGIPIEYPETLFFKLAPSVTLIGIIGAYGKSTVAHLIYSMLKRSFSEYEDQGLFFIDPESPNGVLTHLKKIKKSDVILSRIPDSLLPYYSQINISPYVAVITSITSFDILEPQTYNNFIVAPDRIIDEIKLSKKFISKAKMLRTRNNAIPADWQVHSRAPHFLENASLAMQTAELFKVPMDIVKDVMQKFMGLKGRIEFVKRVNGVEYYNDAYSITPEATLSVLRSISSSRNIVLIMGGAYTPHKYDSLVEAISEHVSTLILLPGSGSLGLRSQLEKIEDIKFIQSFSLEEAIITANGCAKKGDRVLFSPAFDAIGVDISRKERGERFVRAVRNL